MSHHDLDGVDFDLVLDPDRDFCRRRWRDEWPYSIVECDDGNEGIFPFRHRMDLHGCIVLLVIAIAIGVVCCCCGYHWWCW